MQQLLAPYVSVIIPNSAAFEISYVKVVEDRPILLSATINESNFYRAAWNAVAV